MPPSNFPHPQVIIAQSLTFRKKSTIGQRISFLDTDTQTCFIYNTDQKKKKTSNRNKKLYTVIDQETGWPLTKHDGAEMKWA